MAVDLQWYVAVVHWYRHHPQGIVVTKWSHGWSDLRRSETEVQMSLQLPTEAGKHANKQKRSVVVKQL